MVNARVPFECVTVAPVLNANARFAKVADDVLIDVVILLNIRVLLGEPVVTSTDPKVQVADPPLTVPPTCKDHPALGVPVPVQLTVDPLRVNVPDTVQAEVVVKA